MMSRLRAVRRDTVPHVSSVPLRFEVDRHVGVITLDRPEARNALTPELIQALAAAAPRLALDPKGVARLQPGELRVLRVRADIAGRGLRDPGIGRDRNGPEGKIACQNHQKDAEPGCNLLHLL